MKVRILNSSNANNKAVKTYMKAVKAGQHVVPSNGDWAIKKDNAERATKIFDNQKQAIEVAIKIAKNQKAELVIHGRDGKIRVKNSYGSDVFPPRG